MWSDNEAERDLLNFDGVAKTVAELIVSAQGRPVSIGVSGAWGAGKSSMIKLAKAALETSSAEDAEPSSYVFIEFNAWLYQGYDDARAALLDVVADRLLVEARDRKTGLDKVTDFLKRVRWLRLAKLVALPAASMALGLPPIGLLGSAGEIIGNLVAGRATSDDVEGAAGLVSEAAAQGKGLIAPENVPTPPKEIQALRDSFEGALEELGVTLVVLVDDLDRCLPETAVSTLEAIRLLLFLKRTAFVIAADDEMIKYAVRRHFDNLDKPELVTNYFDKLIQVPIRVPKPGIHEIRAYMMMLFVDASNALEQATNDKIHASISDQLQHSWQGKRADREFVDSLELDLPPELIARLDIAQLLAPLMVSASGIAGNPRLVKRFLNTLDIRMSVSRAQGVGVDEGVLAKLLLFERSGPPALYEQLSQAVNGDAEGKPRFLEELEVLANAGEDIVDEGWGDTFATNWLKLVPTLSDKDLRGPMYVGRETAPMVTDADRLSRESQQALGLLLRSPDMAGTMIETLRELPRADLPVVMDALVAAARTEQEWGAPAILDALVVVAELDGAASERLAGFLGDRPPTQIQPAIVPKVERFEWASTLFESWSGMAEVPGPVKAAIEERRSSGNVSKQ